MSSSKERSDRDWAPAIESLLDQCDKLNVDSAEEDEELHHRAKFSSGSKFVHLYFKVAELCTPVSLHYPKWKKLELEQNATSSQESMRINLYALRHHFHTSPISCPIRVHCIYVFIVYMSVKVFAIFVLNLFYDRSINRWKEAITAAWNQGEWLGNFEGKDQTGNDLPRCIRIKTLGDSLKEPIKTLDKVMELNELIKSPIVTNNEIFLFGVVIFWSCVWALIMFAINNPDNPDFRLDVLTFLFDPLLEKQRIKDQARDIKGNLLKLGKNAHVGGRDREFPFQTQSLHPELIANFKIARTVNPAHLTVAGSRRIIRVVLTTTFCLYTGSILIGLLVVGHIFYSEVANRVEYRNEELYCKFMSPDALSTTRPMPLPVLPERLKFCSNSTSEPGTTTFGLELAGMFTPNLYHLVLELVFIYAITAYQICLYLMILVLIRFAHLIWLDQIIAQLRLVEQMMNLATEEEVANGRFIRCKIDETLLITYINYHLFRRSMRCQREFNSTLLRYVSAVVLVGVVLCFVAMLSSNESSRWTIWSVLLFNVFLLHLFGYLAMSSTNSLTRLSVEINRIMVQTARCSMESSAIVSIWRRQIMSQDEIQHAFGIQILGIELSYSNLVQLNSYVLAGFLFFLKSFLNK